eukprot:352390_1
MIEGSNSTMNASVASIIFWYVGFGFLPPVYPTTTSTTPPLCLKSRWGCQNHPEASTATSFDGELGTVEISGQTPIAKWEGDAIFRDASRGIGANAAQDDRSKEPMVAIEDFIGNTFPVIVEEEGI